MNIFIITLTVLIISMLTDICFEFIFKRIAKSLKINQDTFFYTFSFSCFVWNKNI